MHRHRICESVPQVTRTDSFPFLAITQETGNRPTFERVERTSDGTYRESNEAVQFALIGGIPRHLLRHTPLVIQVATLILVAGAWGYYSFWTMHAKMVRDNHRIARQYQGTNREATASRTPAAGDRIHAFQDSEGPEWAALQEAPTWPLDVNQMASLLSSNVLPLLFPVSNVLF